MAREWLLGAILTEVRHQTALQAMSLLKDDVLTVRYRGKMLQFYLPDGAVDIVQGTILRTRTFYEESILRVVNQRYDLRGKTVIDVGGNIGNHTMFLVAICGAATSHMFEPNSGAVEVAERSLSLSQIAERVNIHRQGLADRPGSYSFETFSPANIGATRYLPGGRDELEFRTLDSYAIRDAAFVKIDVEGSSKGVLRGAMETLSASKPPILIELFEGERDACHQILVSIGYAVAVEFEEDNYLYEARV